MSRKNKNGDGGSVMKRHKSDDAKFSFRSLVDILEPDGPSGASSWKSIVDRAEHLVVFFQVDYVHVTPRLSKCIRIQRERVSSLQPERLVPSVYFGKHLDHSFAQKTLGHRYLKNIDDLQILLARVESTEGAKCDRIFENNSGDETEKNMKVRSKSKKKAGFVVILPEVDARHKEGNEAEVEKSGDEQNQNSDLNNNYSSSLETIFISVLPGDERPYPGPELDCQTPGPGKIPLSEDDYHGKNLYVNEDQLRLLQCDWKGRPQTYLIKLFDKLLGAEGLEFVRERRTSRRNAAPASEADKVFPGYHSTTAKELLGEEFLKILQLHMEDNGVDMNVKKICSILRQHWADLFRSTKKSVLPDEISNDDDTPGEESATHEIFNFNAPSVPGEKEDKIKKVPLVHTTDMNYAGMQLYVDKKELRRLKKRCGENVRKYAAGVFDAVMSTEGISIIKEKRRELKEAAVKEGSARTPLFGVRKMFTSDFLNLLRVHLSQNGMTVTTTELVFRLNEHVNTATRKLKSKSDVVVEVTQ